LLIDGSTDAAMGKLERAVANANFGRMAGPPHARTVACMDSLVQLEYIIERERSRAISRQPVDVDEVRPVAASRRFVDHLRRMLDGLRAARGAATYG
jgi:hypothetical protein